MIRKKEEKDEKKFVNPLLKTRTLGTEITFANQTKAGNNKPAFGTSGARSFREYSAIRKQQEQEDGMRSAADRLASQYGYKRVGNQVVFVTPNSPLPKPTAQNTTTRAQAPGAYGIAPENYAADMTAIDRYVNYKYDDETQAFLDQYFNGQLPTEEMFESVFKHYARGGVETEPDVMNFHRGAELVRKATEAKEEARPGYEEAIGRLGEDAVKYLSANESDYYERFGNTYGAADAIANYEEKYNPDTQAFLDKYFNGVMPTEEEFRATLAKYAAGGVENEPDVMNLNEGAYLIAEGAKVKGAGSSDAMTLEDAEKYNLTRFAKEGNDRFDLRRWSVTTPEERAAYQLMTKYGNADEYLKSLEPELNKRIAEAKTAEATQFAEEKPFWANVRSVATAPAAGLGALEMGVNKLMGKDVDLYDPRLTLSRENEAIRTQTASGMNGFGKFAYNTGMSIADNLANMLTWGGLGSFATALSMGGSSAASAFASAVERGANEKQALTAAFVSGVAESLFEKFSLDNVIEMSKGNKLGNHVLNVLKQMGIEGSEELATGIANEIADRAIMGDLSNYELLVDYYVKQGLMEDVARRKAEWSSAGEIGLGALGGVASGGVMGAGAEIIGSYRNRNVQKELDEAAKNLAKLAEEEARAKETPATTAPVPQTRDRAEDARAQLEEEYLAEEETKASAEPNPHQSPAETASPGGGSGLRRENENERSEMREERENEREYMPDPAQEGQQQGGQHEGEQQQGGQHEGEQQQGAEEKPAETDSEGKKEHMFNEPRLATVRTEEGEGGSVNVMGVTVDDGIPLMITQNEKGETDYWMADDLDLDDETNELLSYEGVQRMDGRALRNYLEGYDSSRGSVEEYANAYSSVFQRAKSGVDYEQAALQNDARRYLSEDAMLDAYTAGMNAYNQTHETVQPAAVETVQSETAADGTVMSAKETGKGGTISKQFNAKKLSSMSKKQRNNAIAQMELLKAIASRTGRRIVIVDSITDSKGNHANATYNAETGEIRVALDAEAGAYAYAAMHELTHAMKNEHSSEWQGFVDYVRGVLEGSGQKWDELVQYQMDRFGYSRAVAEEEVICNTVPAILKDERNVLKLYKGNRKLFDRVVDWVRGLLKDIKAAGDTLSKRSESWKQMDALAADRKTMQEIYDRMMAVMEKTGEKKATRNEQKLSAKDEKYDYSKPFAQQVQDMRDGKLPKNDALVISGTPDVLQKIGFSKLPMTINQSHLMQMERDTEHYLSNEMIKQLPELLKDPVAVIRSESDGKNSVVMILKAMVNGKPYVAPAYVMSTSKHNMLTIDSNNIATVFRKKNAVSKLLTDAIQKENAGEIGMYYWNKTEAHNVFAEAGVQFPGLTLDDGLIHSIHDAGSEVNKEYLEQTQTRQFARWFGKSKIVNDDGSPKILYHQTDGVFTVFDTRHEGAGSRDNETPFGIFMKETDRNIGLKGERQMALYAKIENPLIVRDREELVGRLRELSEEYGKLKNKAKSIDAEYSAKTEEAKKQFRDYLTRIREEAAAKGIEPKSRKELYEDPEFNRLFDAEDEIVDEWTEAAAANDRKAKEAINKALKGNGYDGVIIREDKGSFGRKTEAYIALEPTQVKSATDNVGLFDSDNPDIRFSYMGENAQTANIHLLNEAKERLEDGENADQIRKDTGWFKGMDGKWRFETDDSQSKVNISEDNYRELGELLEHKELYEAYPDLEDISVVFQKLDGPSAQYNRVFDSIDVDYSLKNKPEELRKVLMHEVQHAIQARENFTRGASKQYWEKRIFIGFDARRTKDKELVRKANEKLRKIKEENPDFYFDMMKLREIKPDMPRAEIDWETLEPKGEDPIEWQRYDARRDELEQKYGNVKVFDFITIESVKERGAKSRARTADDLYLDTAGEIEARDVTDRADLTKEERKERAPYLGNEDTVFSDEPIYFSMRDSDENIQDALSAEQKAFALVKGHRITAAEADKIAGKVLQKANSDYDRQKLAAEISRIYDYIERGEDVDWNQVDDEMTRLMAKVMEKSRTLNLEHEEMAKPIRDYLKKNGIRLTDKQRTEAANKAGSYGAYSKTMFGRVRLVSAGGTRLDSVWSELNAMNAELFPADASEGDMPMLLMNAVDALKPVYETGKGMNMEESASWMAGQMNEAYFSLPTVKAAANNGKTFGESVAALKDAMKRFEETSWSEYQNALRSIREARGEQKRTQKQEETAALRKKYVNWRERDTAARKEREMKTKYRAKIERTAQTLTNWMLKPTDAKHVPDGVEDSVKGMLKTLDFSGKSTKTAKELSDQLDRLATALMDGQEKEDDDRTIFLERDQQMIDEIRRMAELIRGNTDRQQAEGRGVYDLNGMELKELSKWLDVVKHVVTEASKLRGSNLPGESVEQVATMSMMEMSRKKAWKDKKWYTQKWLENFGPDMQDSFTFFERMGPTANAIFSELREGFDKVTQLTRQAEEHTKTILEGVKLSELTGSKAKKQVFEINGRKLEMTKAQIMDLYVSNRREQAKGHIYGQGIRIQGDLDARAHELTKKDVAMITDTLTADEKRVAEGLQRFLSNECASWGNETSMKLLGYRKFGEENYWPIRTDSNTRNTTKLEDNYAANISAIKNQGMTKATIEGAKNAIVIEDIFDVYTRHISNMAAYAGYALPLSDFTRWYNSRGVKTEIEQMMGKKGLNYINNFLMAVNGSALREEQSGIERAAGWMSRNAKIASVGANLRVVIQQPTSYARAAMYMSPKYLTGALTMKRPDADLINRYCGIAQWKRWGFYETNIGPNLRQMIVGDETFANKMREKAMKPASWGDEWTLNRLWNACELETRELMPELKQGSREYYEAVGKRMSEIIDRTQVVDSVFHRSQMMRSKSGMAQMLTNFMSEPTKTYNMLMSAISDYADNRQNKAARNRVARAFTVYAVSGLLTAAAAAVIDAFRDEDAEKEWLEKYLDAAKENAVDNLNQLGLLPGVKDIMSLLQGYEPSRLDTKSIQKLIWAAQEIQKYADGTSKMNLYGVSYKTAQALSSLFGIPVSNFMRDFNAIMQTATGQSITKTPQARKNDTLTQLYQAITDGKTARAKQLREDLRIKAGMTPKEIDTRLAEMLETDSKVAEAYAAREAKDYATMNRAINALTSKGFGKETVEKAITSYANDQKPKEPKTKNQGEQLAVTFYSEADVVTAMKILAGVEKGGSVTEADVRAMISERVAGSEAKDPEASVKSGIQSELKKEYLEAEARGNTDAMRRIGSVMSSVLGTKQDDMDKWVRDQHSENLRTAIDSRNSAAAMKAVETMRKDGKTDSQIKSSLDKYKQMYIDAVNSKDMTTASRIKSMLMSLGLKGKRGGYLYTEQTFEDWVKK